MENRNRKTVISMITSLIAMAMTIIVNFFLSSYIVRTLGEEANGFTQLANNFVNYASLMTVALNSMAGRFITVNYYAGNKDKSQKYYSSMIVGNCAIVLFLIVPAILMLFNLEHIIQIQTASVIHVKLLFAFVFTNYFVAQINSILNIATYVKNEQYLSNIISMARIIVNALCLLVVFTILLPKIYYVSLIGLLLSCITVPILLIIKQRLLPDIRFDIRACKLQYIKELVLAGSWNVVTQCGNLLMTGMDLLLANLFIGPIPMGILSVAKTIPNAIIQLAGTINTTFSPSLTITYAESDIKEVLKSLRFAMKCSGIVVSIPIVAFCMYSVDFYSLWVPTMDSYQLALLSFLSCAAFIPFAGPQVLYNVFTTTNRLKVNSITVLIAGICNIALVIVFVRFWGMGLVAIAGISSILTILRNLCITVPYAAKVLNIKWYTFYKDVFISCLCCLANAVACFVTKIFIVPTSWITLVSSVALACFLSVALSSMILLNKEERQYIITKLRRKNHG